MQMDVIATTKRGIAVAIAVFAVVFLLLLAWIGTELRYSNCLTKEDLAGRDGSACSRFP